MHHAQRPPGICRRPRQTARAPSHSALLCQAPPENKACLKDLNNPFFVPGFMLHAALLSKPSSMMLPSLPSVTTIVHCKTPSSSRCIVMCKHKCTWSNLLCIYSKLC